MTIKIQVDLQVLDRLQAMRRMTGAPNVAAVIGTALQIYATLLSKASLGYGEVVVRNSLTGDEEVVAKRPPAELIGGMAAPVGSSG